jgi:osmoprotectant transport system ATP-binding protein
VRGVPIAERQSRLEELATLVGLNQGLLERYPSQLSGGQRQRVALMRALFQKPEVLLLDEPMGALDPLIRHELQETLKSVFTTLRTTVVLVTHDVGEAAFFGDTITLLYEGRILQHGAFLDLVHRPAHARVTSFLRAQRPVPLLGEIPA